MVLGVLGGWEVERAFASILVPILCQKCRDKRKVLTSCGFCADKGATFPLTMENKRRNTKAPQQQLRLSLCIKSIQSTQKPRLTKYTLVYCSVAAPFCGIWGHKLCIDTRISAEEHENASEKPIYRSSHSGCN